jgi:hypothetical protein
MANDLGVETSSSFNVGVTGRERGVGIGEKIWKMIK